MLPAMKTRQYIIDICKAYQAAHGLSDWRFGVDAVGDHRFMLKLRHGQATLRVIERAERYMTARTRRAA